MPNSSKKQTGWPYYLQILCALAGLGLSAYLLVQHTRLKNGIQDGASFCSFGTWANCDTVNSSQYSEVGGVPLATIGYLYFGALLMLSLLARPGRRGFRTTQRWAACLVSLGILTDLVLLGIQLFVVKSICLMCSATYLANIGYFLSAVLMVGANAPGWAAKVKSTFNRSSEPVAPQPLAFATFGWLAIAVSVFVIPGTIVSKTVPASDGALNEAAKIAETWDKMPTQDLPVTSGNGTVGNPMAKIRIVEFSDFECPFCQRASGPVHQAMESMKDRVYFAFKHFPLDNACNPKLPYPMHPNSCKLAELAFCAKEKGKFWEYHDAVFGIDENALKGDINTLQKPLEKVFSAAEFKACLNSTAAKASVKEDIDLGIKLGVNSTPSLFINGKKLIGPLTEDNIRLFVEREEQRLK